MLAADEPVGGIAAALCAVVGRFERLAFARFFAMLALGEQMKSRKGGCDGSQYRRWSISAIPNTPVSYMSAQHETHEAVHLLIDTYTALTDTDTLT